MLMAEDSLLLTRNSVNSFVPEMNLIHWWNLLLLAPFLPIFLISDGRNSRAQNKDCHCGSAILLSEKDNSNT